MPDHGDRILEEEIEILHVPLISIKYDLIPLVL
jgi:hypothetical protein